jgi:hypothetical protein
MNSYLACQIGEYFASLPGLAVNQMNPEIHGLVVLLRRSKGLLRELVALRQPLAHLTTFGVAARYPVIRADALTGRSAVGTAGLARAKLVEPALQAHQAGS